MTDLDLSAQTLPVVGASALGNAPQARRRIPGSRKPIGHRVRWIALAVGGGLIAVMVVLATAPPTTQYEADSPLIGHRAPAVTGRTLLGERFDLSTLRGHFAVIDFFASWCVPCQSEQPELVRFAEHPRAGAELVGVVFHDSTASIRALIGPWAGLYPVLIDPGGTIALNYGVDNPPSKYVIDPRGRVVAKIIGPVTAAGLDSVIKRAQAEGL